MEDVASTEMVKIEGLEGATAPLCDAAQYEQRLVTFRTKISSLENKFNLVLHALDWGEILPEPMKKAMGKVVGMQGESDFHIITLVRLLYLGDESVPPIAAAKQEIISALAKFPFWPSDCKCQPSFDKLVFWSENHLFMTLGSCYLFHQYALDPAAITAAPETRKAVMGTLDAMLETKLLKIYLRAHYAPEFNGVYEVNSTVYLPYTLSALFNLYDFAVDEEIRLMAHHIIDRVLFHVLLGTTSNGTSNLVAGARTFARTRLRTHGHNMNQLMNVLIGTSPDPPVPSAITDFILTTKWRPNYDVLKPAWEFTGAHPSIHMSHPAHGTTDEATNETVSGTRQLYEKLAKELDVPTHELVPFYWSAGLVTHPDFVTDTRKFQKRKGMQKNSHLCALEYESMFIWGSMKGSMKHYSTLSKGQMYTGIELNVFKHPQQQLVLTSFERFNPHCASFQQLPWIANVSGVGVWSQAGSGSEACLNFGMTQTHNPVVTQRGSVLIASYCTPAALSGRMIMGSLFSSSVRLYWPIQFFDDWVSFRAPKTTVEPTALADEGGQFMQHRRSQHRLNEDVTKKGTWCVAQRGEAFIGVYCSQKTHMDHRHAKDAEMKLTPTSEEVHAPVRTATAFCRCMQGVTFPAVHAPRRICDEYRHSWVAVVGSTRDYDSLEAFVNKRILLIRFGETNGGGSMFEGTRHKYEFTVTDTAGEGTLRNTVALPT